jgi:hypothetical protein
MQSFAGLFLTVILILTAAYGAVIKPAIQREVRNEVYDLRESVEFLKCQLRATMTEKQMERALILYEQSKCERGKR